MSVWNYRFIRQKSNDPDDGYYYVLAEVYYDDDGSPGGYVEAKIGSESIESAKDILIRMQEAFMHPYIDESEFGDKHETA